MKKSAWQKKFKRVAKACARQKKTKYKICMKRKLK